MKVCGTPADLHHKLFQPAAAEEGVRVGLAAGELLVEHHRFLAATLLEEGLAELLRQVEVPDTVRALLEEGEGSIYIKNGKKKVVNLFQ